ncbi:MAG: CapA family protein [Bacteroidales bacterium]|nr:CapA family protein [Bacteroidales bacterium]
MSLKRKILLVALSIVLLLVVVAFILNPFLKAGNKFGKTNLSSEKDSVTFWVTGDAMMHMPQYKAALNHETGLTEFDSCFTLIRPILNKADVRMVNFETTLAGKPYSGFPRFSAPKEFPDALCRAGFNLFLFANNHCNDKGKAGILGNINYADSVKIWHTGIFKDSADRKSRYPLMLNINNWKIAVLNYTYGTNGFTEPKPLVINRIDSTQILKDILTAKLYNADAILAAMHWGEEYQHKQNFKQKQIASFLLENGVDVIIGSHPHIVQPIELVTPIGSMNEKLVIWSLGNFISNQNDQYTDAGLLVGFTLKKDLHNKTIVSNVKYVPLYRMRFLSKKPGYFMMPGILTEKNIDSWLPNSEIKEDFISVMKDTRKKVNTSERIVEVEN